MEYEYTVPDNHVVINGRAFKIGRRVDVDAEIDHGIYYGDYSYRDCGCYAVRDVYENAIGDYIEVGEEVEVAE